MPLPALPLAPSMLAIVARLAAKQLPLARRLDDIINTPRFSDVVTSAELPPLLL